MKVSGAHPASPDRADHDVDTVAYSTVRTTDSRLKVLRTRNISLPPRTAWTPYQTHAVCSVSIPDYLEAGELSVGGVVEGGAVGSCCKATTTNESRTMINPHSSALRESEN